MKKFIINIVLILFVFFLFECYAYSTLFVSDKFSFPDYTKYKKLKEEFLVDNHLYTNYAKPKKGDPIYFEADGRSLVGENYKKRPILLLGDSYTYGLGLKKEETFGYQLSEYTKRPVYNWGWCTEGVEYPLMQMLDKRNIALFNGVSPEYIIYLYPYPAASRVVLKQRVYRWFYLRQLGLCGSKKISFFDNFYIVNFLKNILFIKSLAIGSKDENVFDYITNIILRMRQFANIEFKDSKFIVLIYSDNPELVKRNNLQITELEEKILNSPRWKEFSDKNSDKLLVISTEELLGRKMDKQEDIIDNERTVTIHPSAKAWAEIVPALSKKLNLI